MRKSEAPTRVKPSFKPKMISNAEIVFLKEDERGKFYIMNNPEGPRYIKVHESAYDILKMLNGVNTVEDIEKKVLDEKIPLDTQKFLRLLAEEGFIENLKHQQKGQEDEYYSFRIKFFNLDAKIMNKVCHFFSFVRNPFFKTFYLSFVVGGLFLFFYNIASIFSVAIELWKMETPLLPLLLSIPLFYLIKFLHELSHAAAYSFFKGKSAKMGLEFHFLIPFYYTETPDARKMTIRENIIIFSAGSLTNIFFAEIFTYLFILTKDFSALWAFGAFSFHLSTMVSLSPFLRTDGYFIAQSVLKFPNLLEHGISNLTKVLQLIFRKISLREYKDYLSQYSDSERRILMIYTFCLCMVVFILVYFSIVLALIFGLVTVLSLTPQVFAGKAPYAKVYFLWALYVFDIILSFVGILGTAVHIIRKKTNDFMSHLRN